MQPATDRAAIAGMGRVLNPDVLAATQALHRGAHERAAMSQPPVLADAAYGEHPRQVLDLYAPVGASGPAPILLWVHGGGFLRGDKRGEELFNAHAGRWAAREGMLGAVMNYRLAPESTWPSGGEDVVAAVAWLRERAADHGGDPSRIVVVGTSAGAVHIATALQLAPQLDIAGAVLLSGLYGFTPLDDRDTLYYGPHDRYVERMPRDAVVATPIPLLLVCSEFDPRRFQAEMLGLLEARLEEHGAMPRATIVSGHNHFSLAYHIGTDDSRLADEILSFIGELA